MSIIAKLRVIYTPLQLSYSLYCFHTWLLLLSSFFVWVVDRKQRFEKVTKDLKVKRVFHTLLEEMKAIGVARSSGCTEVMMPVALSERSPVLLLMGGGMGAGKSTVLKEIMKEYSHFHSFIIFSVLQQWSLSLYWMYDWQRILVRSRSKLCGSGGRCFQRDRCHLQSP